MKILMLSSAPGSVDGIRVGFYEAGQEYDLTVSPGASALAAVFVDSGFAQKVGADQVAAHEVAGEGDAEQIAVDVGTASAAPKPGRKPKAP